LGEVLWDRLADQPDLPLSAVRSWTSYPGGAPANVACALTKLGIASSFVGCVGQDASGRSLVQTLQELSVDTSGVQFHPCAPTRQVYVTRSRYGERQFAGFGQPTSVFADAHLEASLLPESPARGTLHLGKDVQQGLGASQEAEKMVQQQSHRR
jgi:fructokinase